MTAPAFPVAPDACVHRNLHPGRLDGSHTICLDCGSHVCITGAHHVSGEMMAAQAARMLAELDAEEAAR
jgi:hypothetical protein